MKKKEIERQIVAIVKAMKKELHETRLRVFKDIVGVDVRDCYFGTKMKKHAKDPLTRMKVRCIQSITNPYVINEHFIGMGLLYDDMREVQNKFLDIDTKAFCCHYSVVMKESWGRIKKANKEKMHFLIEKTPTDEMTREEKITIYNREMKK